MTSIIKNGYVISDSREIDYSAVTDMLKNAYWTPGIGLDEVRKGADNSALVVSVSAADGKLAGYSRVISDKTRFAYILDVYVQEEHRKKGIGQAMVDFILGHHDLKDVYQWMLITNDAHGVYSKSGFKPLSNPDKWMEIRHQRPER